MRSAALALGFCVVVTCVARAQDVGAPSRVPGTDWKIQQSAAAVPGNVAVVLTVQPSAPIVAGADSIVPTLVLRCRAGTFSAYVAAATMLETSADGSTFIRLRWNHDSSSIVQRWPGSASHQSVFSPDALQFVESLIKSDTLRIAFVPQDEPAVEVAFDVRGLAAPATSLARGCPDAGLASVVPNVPGGERVVAAADTLVSPVTFLHWQEPMPEYPEAMLHVRTSGRVVVQFMLDTTGSPESPTLNVVSYTEPAYAVYAVNVMRQGRFTPATVAGHRVRVVAVDTLQLTFLRGCMPSERVTCYEFRTDETLRVRRAP